MPVYEFKCQDCSHFFEGLYKIGTKAEDLDCPECNKNSLKKVFSLFAVSSKGGNGSDRLLSNSGSSRSCSSCSGGNCASC